MYHVKFEVTIWFKLSNNLAKLLFVTTNPQSVMNKNTKKQNFPLIWSTK